MRSALSCAAEILPDTADIALEVCVANPNAIMSKFVLLLSAAASAYVSAAGDAPLVDLLVCTESL